MAADIILRDVSKYYGNHRAITNIDLTVAAGSLVALLGPSGCGKTTLLRTVAGLESCDGGQIIIGGKDITSLPVSQREIGFVFQNYAVFPHLTVAQNIAFGLSVRKWSNEKINARVAEMLELVGLQNYSERFPSQLSGGQRQRVAFARVLAVKPKILLLDEPFGALDTEVRKELRAWLKDLHRHSHLTTVIVTHDAEEAIEIADEIVLMDAGVIQQRGAPQDLYDSPSSLFAMKFLGRVTDFPTESGELVYLRPHQFRVESDPFAGALKGEVLGVARRGATVHFDVQLGNGKKLSAEIANDRLGDISQTLGSNVYLAPMHALVFAGSGRVK